MSHALHIVNGVMKSVRHLILRVTRKSPPIYRQMELSLPGSRITRDEASFLRELRHVREQLTATRT
jgi:hypothetical protein